MMDRREGAAGVSMSDVRLVCRRVCRWPRRGIVSQSFAHHTDTGPADYRVWYARLAHYGLTWVCRLTNSNTVFVSIMNQANMKQTSIKLTQSIINDK
jgi:hypothetical protein